MQVIINSAFLPGVNEASEMYCWLLHILHFSENIEEIKSNLDNLKPLEKERLNRYFQCISDEKGIHFFQRKYSDPNKSFNTELFKIN